MVRRITGIRTLGSYLEGEVAVPRRKQFQDCLLTRPELERCAGYIDHHSTTPVVVWHRHARPITSTHNLPSDFIPDDSDTSIVDTRGDIENHTSGRNDGFIRRVTNILAVDIHVAIGP